MLGKKIFNNSHNSLLARLALLSTLAFSQSVLAHADAHSNENTSPSTRVVSAGAGVTELVLALDAGNELVAVDSTSQLPKGFDKVEKLGYHRMLSAEGILALSPNLVLGTDAMGPKATLDVLSGAKVNVIQLPDANTQAQLLSNINEMGKLLNREEQANTLQDQVKQSFLQIENKQQQIAKQGDAPKVLFLLLQADRPARVGGDNTAADIIIKLAGGKNIAGFSGYKSVSQEGILSLQPDVILISNRSDKSIENPINDLLKQMPLLEHTSAGKNKQIQSLQPQALLGGLGLSAIKAADKLASDFINVKQY
ncbi:MULTISPECIES: hemin ABC transporter substrate-binding protein [unclassified Shewanella]|uniref:heme/hemin ABC transporter substrate-binding protein n=1 Tax=unclassified Shewanella TaxID=196818 RepID=UPI001BC7A683|nr:MULTISPECIES: hemin ABC transporter substrate-binding protein [unclassified Shewanella]GIU05368.1 hemin ABC transporter substrate-binding protein [Shewanella sp. MBTL60-112-B1]GIU24068.1 hemin ABC transporter substrate-binding protein [Shewanella sp. MBTL60-112-B2]